MAKRQLISERDVIAIHKAGGNVLAYSEGAIITPLARDTAKQKGIAFVLKTASDPSSTDIVGYNSYPQRTIVIGSDHRGYKLKKTVIEKLASEGFQCIDVGSDSEIPSEFPIFAFAVAKLVASGKANAGIMIDRTGIGSAIAANKVPGIRAANCHDLFTIRNAREHNDANVLTFGGAILGIDLANELALSFLRTPFLGGRHAERLIMINDIEKKGLKD